MPVSVHEITMAAPDIVCVEVRDPPSIKGPLIGPVEEDYSAWPYFTFFQEINPNTSALEWCEVIGPDKNYLKFVDIGNTEWLNRDAADVAGDWGAIGARTVTNVYRKSYAYDSGEVRYPAGNIGQSVSMKHFLYLKLDGVLAEGSYTIDFPAGTGIANTAFVFDDKVTRCSSIRNTQVGVRPSDVCKLGYLAVWVPGAPNEGEIEFSATQFYVIDESGTEVAGPFDIELRIDATTVETQGPSGTNAWKASTSTEPLTATNVVGNVVTYTGSGWTPVNGDKCYIRGTSGMLGLEGYLATISNVGVSGANTFHIDIDTTPYGSFTTGTYVPEFEWKLYKGISANRAGTSVYGLDYSSWTTGNGVYRLYIPGLGVSDEFRVDNDVWWDVAKNSMGGIYNQRNGIALDGRFGYTRPIAFRGDISRSRMPGALSGELGIGADLPSLEGGNEPCRTAEVVTDWFGTHNDAGDWDSFIWAHCPSFYWLLDQLVEFASPTIRSEGVFGVPKSSETLGALYAGTDDMPDAFHEALWMFDAYRRLQKPDGSVGSGIGYTGFSSGGAQTSRYMGNGPSWLPVSAGPSDLAFIYAPDHASNYMYALAAAKIANICKAEGFTALETVWTDSAIDAWDWAESIAFNSTAHDAHYLTYCDVRNIPRATPVAITAANTTTNVLTCSSGLTTGRTVRVLLDTLVGPTEGTTYYIRNIDGLTCTLHAIAADASTGANPVDVVTSGTGSLYAVYTDAEYATAIATVQSNAVGDGTSISARTAAAACLFRLTNDNTYGDLCDGFIGQPLNTLSSITMWEYAHASGGDEGVKAYYLADFADGISQIPLYSESNVAYRNQGYPQTPDTRFQGFSDIVVWKMMLNPDDQYLGLMQAGRQFVHGANQSGMCQTTGIGVRVPTDMLHVDTGRSGFSSPPPGITYYGLGDFFPANFGNFWDAHESLGVAEKIGISASDQSKAKTWEPYRPSVPKYEFLVENKLYIQQMEYTYHQTTVPELLETMYLHTHDGNEHSGGASGIAYNCAGLRFRFHT